MGEGGKDGKSNGRGVKYEKTCYLICLVDRKEEIIESLWNRCFLVLEFVLIFYFYS